jgi:CHAT domain-containing protein/tetratricopeptide (TPR) repeat protein
MRGFRTTLIVAGMCFAAQAGVSPAMAQQGADSIAALQKKMGQLYGQGRYAEAVAVGRRVLALTERAYGSSSLAAAKPLNNLAVAYQKQGRYAEAEPLYKRAIAINEKMRGSFHPSVATGLNNLGMLFYNQGRYAEAEALHKRAFAIRKKALPPLHPDIANSANNLALVYEIQGKYKEAEALFKRSILIIEKSYGPENTLLAPSLNGLARVYGQTGRLAEAEVILRRSISIRKKVLGPDHPDVATSMHNLALNYQAQGEFVQAEKLFKRDLTINERKLGPDHPVVGIALRNLGGLYMAGRDWSRAAKAFRRSAAIANRRAERSSGAPGQALSGKQDREAAQSASRFVGFIKAANRLASEGRNAPALSREAFQTAQWAAASGAARSLAQMAARGAKGDPALAALVRERQDLVGEWLKRDRARSAALSAPRERRNQKAMAANDSRLAAIDSRIARIDQRLTVSFPDYAALARPGAIPVEDVQAQLRPGEALVLFLDTGAWQTAPEETFIWVVTRTGFRWARSGLGTAALTREVQALRCGLDAAAWAGEGARSCSNAAGAAAPGSASLPFDLARANKLYKALFGEVEDLIKGKSLLLVLSGPLTQLPFQVLVTAPGNGGDYKSAAWLARRHALTVLPAVSSLKALRRTARPSAASKPIIGVGNPLLDGDKSDPEMVKLARLARGKQRCTEPASRAVAAAFVQRGGTPPLQTRGGLADASRIRALAPLPETADELCAVARDLGGDPNDIRLGARAAEAKVKALSESGQLAQFRILHFATHGALAGQLDADAEAGLILTPPARSTPEDDGYLSASEIASLKLDADWVILSACNTAAGNAAGAEALSGMARAFFYAQARALLVSHWEVNSEATVKLITSAARALAQDRAAGRAEAMRRAMLDLIDSGAPEAAHPSYWAPFVVVGEGGR